MSIFDAIVLGIIQGLAEFLPVSSSGHLVLSEHLLGVKAPGVSFEVLIHIGTLASVLIYFRARLYTLVRSLFVRDMVAERKIVWYLILGTIPAGFAGVLLKEWFEKAFSNPTETSVALLVTGVILLLPKLRKRNDRDLSVGSVLTMGIGQAVAILPGISRSGTTIVSGMLAGVKPAEAAEFSFLLSIPAIAGAAVLKYKDLLSLPSTLVAPYTVAALVAFVFGLLAMYVVLTTVKRGKFSYFAYYCFAIGALGLYHFL
jgi:undecaprenyl-diphosphatase